MVGRGVDEYCRAVERRIVVLFIVLEDEVLVVVNN